MQVGVFYIQLAEYFRTRISCHTETDVVGILRKYSTDMQPQMFHNRCFVYFMNPPPFKIQNQLLHYMLLREAVPRKERELWVKLNNCLLHFSIGEFVVIIKLKCVGDDIIVYIKAEVNRFLLVYFSGDEKKSIIRHRFLITLTKKNRSRMMMHSRWF